MCNQIFSSSCSIKHDILAVCVCVGFGFMTVDACETRRTGRTNTCTHHSGYGHVLSSSSLYLCLRR
eukprot:m.168990 g.168990  ORF g.168990 m.168990 type:complete len:66 (-) comp31542_c10_seq1:166-363(-)